MTSITMWVTQIIIFLIFATIISLIIPNNRMKGNIQMVIGLVLLLIFAKPLLAFFSFDVDAQINRVDQMIFEDQGLEKEVEKSMNNQKSEIETVHDAYILKEVERQLVLEANPVITESFDMEVIDVTLHFSEEHVGGNETLLEHFESITVFLSSNDSFVESKHIDPVVIDTKEEAHENRTQDTSKLKQELANVWGMDVNQIQLNIEGGTS